MTSVIRGDDNFDSGDVPEDTVKAWVYTYTYGTQTIKDSKNVSSVTDIGTGNVRANFSTSMTNIYFATAGSAGYSTNPYRYLGFYEHVSSSYMSAVALYDAQSNYDVDMHCMIAFDS